jgi:hypothetical protein
MLEPVMEHGLQVLVYKRDGETFIDVQTGAKSHCCVVLRDGKMYALTRYDPPQEFEDLHELSWIVSRCKCGRDYFSRAWSDFLER